MDLLIIYVITVFFKYFIKSLSDLQFWYVWKIH